MRFDSATRPTPENEASGDLINPDKCEKSLRISYFHEANWTESIGTGDRKMLIVWRGFGWLVPVVVIAALILSQLSVDAVYGEGFYTANTWPKQAAFIVAALSIGFLGFFL